MSQARLFRLGAGVDCADGECGRLSSLVVSPGDDVVTHLFVDPAHQQAAGKLVPLELDPAEATRFYSGDEDYQVRPGGSTASWPSCAPPGVMGAPGLPADPGPGPKEYTVDLVPDELPGEDEVSRGQHAHAQDGDIGHIQGIAVDPADGRVTSVLLRTGHLWNHRVVLIPRSAVAEVGADGFRLNITSEQVRDLPPANG